MIIYKLDGVFGGTHTICMYNTHTLNTKSMKKKENPRGAKPLGMDGRYNPPTQQVPLPFLSTPVHLSARALMS